MTRFPIFSGPAALILFACISGVLGHGYMSEPVPRGIEKVNTNIDSLKSPNSKGMCRGIKTPGKITDISGSIDMVFTITAAHTGMCEAYLLDLNLGNAVKLGTKDGCAAPDEDHSWSVKIPSGVSGRKVLRWTWNANHNPQAIEHYEQCADINITGGSGSSSKSTNKKSTDTSSTDTSSTDTSSGKNKRKRKNKGTDSNNTDTSSETTDEDQTTKKSNKRSKKKSKKSKKDQDDESNNEDENEDN